MRSCVQLLIGRLCWPLKSTSYCSAVCQDQASAAAKVRQGPDSHLRHTAWRLHMQCAGVSSSEGFPRLPSRTANPSWRVAAATLVWAAGPHNLERVASGVSIKVG